MQERQLAGEAEQRAPSWYLARGDKQYGPLADRELLLLAERGGLRTDDLLWKPGFETWKPVCAVCDLVASFPIASIRDAAPQDTEDLCAYRVSEANLAEAAESEPQAPKRSLKTRFYDELKKFLILFAYLWLVFLVFFVHEWIVLASNHIGFRFYGLAAINALVLAKIMLIAEGMRFAERFHSKPLIVPIAYKSVMFSALLVAAYIAEEIVIGLFHGKNVAESFPQIGGGGLTGTMCVALLLCVALVPFFTLREIAGAIGEAKFRSLMLGPAKSGPDPLPLGAAREAA
jgi:GYF domain 2